MANWIKTAVNPAHKGFCSPTTKATCTPRRKALAMRFKSGDLHKHNLKRKKMAHKFGAGHFLT